MYIKKGMTYIYLGSFIRLPLPLFFALTKLQPQKNELRSSRAAKDSTF